MSVVYIKFKDPREGARAIHEITRTGRVSGYRNGVWGVGREHLSTVEALNVEYQHLALSDAPTGTTRNSGG